MLPRADNCAATPSSRLSRTNRSCMTRPRSISETAVSRCGKMFTRPSRCKRINASRTGVRLTPRCSASSCARNTSPGFSASVIISPRSCKYILSWLLSPRLMPTPPPLHFTSLLLICYHNFPKTARGTRISLYSPAKHFSPLLYFLPLRCAILPLTTAPVSGTI